jgi:mono/diheme cytochrome c family protein
MKRWLKLVAYLIGGFVVLLAAAITATIGWRPFIGPEARPLTNRTFEKTPERLVRGEYLAENVLDCFGCHGEHDWTQHDAPLVPGTKGAGYAKFPDEGLPGNVVPPNITPDPETGAGTWTDDMLARAIREGIGHDGRALFDMMPYKKFASLSDEDLASVIVYIRSIPPVRKALPKTELIFPVNYLIRSIPKPITAPVPTPDLSTPAKRGEFLVYVADCSGCHTPITDKGEPIAGLEFGGGQIFKGPWGTVATANLTPDPTGIPYYDEAMFVDTIRTGYVKGARKLNPIMPWHIFRNMTDEDLKDIFAYLRTLPPVQHHVDNTETPTLCKRCGHLHGLGDHN